MGLEGNIEAVTPLFYEMYICSEIFGGKMLHEEFETLSTKERLKWYYYTEMKSKRAEYFEKKHREKIDSIRNK